MRAQDIDHGLTDREIRDMEPMRNIVKAAVMLLLIFILSFVLGLVFRTELESAGIWLVERFGYLGLFIATLVMDTFIMPMSPDVLLFISIAGDMDTFLALVTVTVASMLGGVNGYLIGRFIGHRKAVRVLLGRNYNKGIYLAQKYGMWAVVLGAFTPIPFSTTCWLAGMFELDIEQFLIAVTYRIPRFLLWYLIIGLGFRLL